MACRDKDHNVYTQELEGANRINKALHNAAFRDIALGENHTLSGERA